MLVGMKAYSFDLRQKILRACDQRLGSQRAMATLFGVSQAVVEKLLRRRRATGDIRPRPHAGGRRALCDATALGHVRRLVQEHAEATLAELAAQLEAQHGLRVSVPTLGRLVLSLTLPRKNRRSMPMRARPPGASRRARPLRQRARRSRPRAARASMQRASPWRCPGCRAEPPAGSGLSGLSRGTMGRTCPCGRPWGATASRR
jgi:transposase